MMTGTENSASDGYGRSDLIQERSFLSARCLEIQSETLLATGRKTASIRKYTAASTNVSGFRIRFTGVFSAKPSPEFVNSFTPFGDRDGLSNVLWVPTRAEQLRADKAHHRAGGPARLEFTECRFLRSA